MKKQLIYAGNTFNFERLAVEAINNGAERVIILTCDCQWYGDSKPSSKAKFFERHPIKTFRFCVDEEFCCDRRRVSDDEVESEIPAELLEKAQTWRMKELFMENLIMQKIF